MKPKPQGNGSGKFNIVQSDMGGWVRIHIDQPASGPSDLPVFLSQTLAEWFRKRPHLLLQSVVPINRDGDTVELHAWYRVHVLPALQGPAPSSKP